jgi:diguanylate cyclase (GGDEF)-like protein
LPVFTQIHELNGRAWQLLQKNPHQAIDLSEQAAALSQSAGAYGSPYAAGLAESWYQLGRFHLQLAHYDQAFAYLGQAQQQYELLEDTDKLISISIHTGVTYAHVGDYAEAMQHLLRGLAAARRAGKRSLEATALNNIGFNLLSSGEYEQALPNLEESLALFRELNDRDGQATTLDSLAQAHLGLRAFDQALRSAEEGVALCQDLGLRRREATYLDTAGRIQAAQGQPAAAEKSLRAALELARGNGYRLEEEVALRHLGALQAQLGKLDAAQASLERAAALAAEIGARHNEYEGHEILAALYRRQGRFEQALEHFERFHAVKESVFNERNEMRLRGLAIQHRLESAEKEAEIYQLRSKELEREVGERRKSEAVLQELATTDALTGLANRRQVLDLAARALAISQRYRHPLAVIMLDIDRFKTINDTYGHAAGDLVIVEFTRRIRVKLRTSDILGRYGGDEFLVVLPQTDVPGALPIVRRIQESIISRPVALSTAQVAVGTSIGVRGNEADYTLGLEVLIEHADAALYKAKTGGRNRIEVYQPAE